MQKTGAGLGRRAVLAWLLPAALLAVSLAVFGIRYDTNDDATIANIAAGAYGPDAARLIFVNILFGWVLRPLYALAPGANWYVLVSLALVLAGGAALCWLAMRQWGLAAGAGVFLAAALPFATEVLYRFEFTKNAAVCAVAGLAWLTVYMGQPLRKNLPGLALALAGSLLRSETFFAVGGLWAAVLLARFVALDRGGKRRALAAAALLAGLVLGALLTDALAYRLDDGWRLYTQYNAARSRYSDYTAYRLGEANPFADEGITDNDYAMLQGWDFYDGSVFPAQRLAALAAQAETPTLWATAKATVRRCVQMLYDTSYRYAFTLALAAALLRLLRRRDRWLLPLFGTLALLGGEVFYLTWCGRMPRYVEVALLLAAGVCLLLCTDGGGRRPQAVPVQWAAAALLALALVSVPGQRAALANSADYAAAGRQAQARFDALSADKEHLYLLADDTVSALAGYDVWHPRPAGYFSNLVRYGGWMSFAPHRQAALTAYGVTDPLTDAVDAPRVLLGPENIDRAVTYAAEHLGRPVEAVAVESGGQLCYRLVSAAAEGGAP